MNKTSKEIRIKLVPVKKIKAIYPHIVVTGDAEKPYYSIQWYDIEKREMNDGYASYNLRYVKKWLKERFEEVSDIEDFLSKRQSEIEVAEEMIRSRDKEINRLLLKLYKPQAGLITANNAKVTPWISVKERLPKEDTRVLVYLDVKKLDAHTYTFCDTDRVDNGKWVRWGKFITHWMPLPEPPKEGAGNAE